MIVLHFCNVGGVEKKNLFGQGWAITFLSVPDTDNKLGYWAGGSKFNMKP